MRAILSRRTIIIFCVAVLLAAIAVVSVNVLNSPGPVTGVANTVTRPVRLLASTVAQTFSRIFASMYEYDQLVARNDELQRRMAEMERDYRESQDLREENDRLRAQLNFRARNRNYSTDMVAIESPGGDNWSSTFIIDRGYANSNITAGKGVVTEEGVLIGQVYSVGATRSTIITVLDTKFSASAYVGSSVTGYEASGSAVARGDFAYMSSGLLVLDQIDDDLIIRRGDSVITSGGGAVYPAGLIVGQVQEVIRNPSGIGRYAVITPMVTFETLTDVYVIIDFIAEGEAEDIRPEAESTQGVTEGTGGENGD